MKLLEHKVALKDKVAIVSGSGQGIGEAIASRLANEGAKVITNNRMKGAKNGDANSTANKINEAGGKALPFFGDVGKTDIAEQLIDYAVGRFGRVDILVNNAGSNVPRPIWNMNEKEWDEVINSYLKNVFNCTYYAIQYMKSYEWGRVINITPNAWPGAVEPTSYEAAKNRVAGFTKAVAQETEKYKITCNAVSPEGTAKHTPAPDTVKRIKTSYKAGLITKEEYAWAMQTPPIEYVTSLIIYLCTDEASNVNGRVFRFIRTLNRVV